MNLTILLLASLPFIQAPEAPFAPKAVELEKVAPVIDSSRIAAGTKSLSWYNLDHNMAIASDGLKLAEFRSRFEPTAKWAPFEKFKCAMCPDGSVVRTTPFTLKDGTKGVFEQTFSVRDGKGVVRSHWNAEKKSSLSSQVFTMSIPFDIAKGRRIIFTDAKGRERICQLPEEDKWGDRTKRLWVNMFVAAKPVSMEVDPDHPETSYKMSFAPDVLKQIIVFRGIESAELYFVFSKERLCVPFEIMVDFGKSIKPATGDCILNGINFTKNDDVVVPRWGRRNMIQNPSFEADVRYSQDAKATYDNRKDLVEGEGRTGKYAFKGSVRTFIIPTTAGRKYTFSFYARNPEGTGGRVAAFMRHFNFGTPQMKPMEFFLKRGDKSWQRFEVTFDWPDRGVQVSLARRWCKETIYFDDLQLEEGEKATEYEHNPYCAVMETRAANGYWGDADETIAPEIEVCGPVGGKGVVDIEVKNFFGHVTHVSREKFEIGPNGASRIAAAPEKAIAMKGVYRIKATVAPDDSRAFTECFRLVRYKFADGTAPNRFLHQRSGINSWNQRNQLHSPQMFFDFYRSCGMCPRAKTIDDWTSYVPQEIAGAIAERCRTNGLTSMEWVFTTHASDVFARHGIATNEMPSKVRYYTPEYLEKVESAVREIVEKAPWNRIWVGVNEVGQSFECTKARDYKEYAKFNMAVHRAVHAVNPKNIFVVYSVCNLGVQGRSEIKEFLAAGLEVDPKFRFDAVDVHPYRPHPEYPNLDNDFKMLFDDLHSLGYDDMLVYGLEGAYFFPVKVAEWNGISPWQATLTKDGYALCQNATYDLGWGERVAASMMMRYNLQTYKYLPRLKALSSWGPSMLDAYNPYAKCVAIAAETEMFGSAIGIGDFRFGKGSRCYLYNDGRGNCLAAVWKFSVPLDYGNENASEMYVELPTGCRIYDMMANEVQAKKDGGKTILPLSNFPVILKVPADMRAQLESAIRNCTTSDVEKDGEYYTQPVLKVPYVKGALDWSKVPAGKLDNVVLMLATKQRGGKWGGADDCSGEFRFAWNEKGLYLRVDVKDDIFCLDHGNKSCKRWGISQWYNHEAVQVYFDSLCDAGEKFRNEIVGHDDNDYGYELLPKDEKSAIVYRRLAPDFQYTGGNVNGLFPNVVEPGIKCDFKWDAEKKLRVYEVFFPSRYLMPALIKENTKIGVGFDVFDRDAPGQDAKQSIHNIPTKLGTGHTSPHGYTILQLVK